MKKLLLILTILFTSACSSATYLSECLNKDNNYINKDLIEDYNKEKTVYIDTDNNSTCITSRRCNIITVDDRWDNIEIYLKPKNGSFPEKKGLYSVSRDYTLKKCLKKYSVYGNNLFTDSKNKDFCVSATEIKKPISNVIFKTRQNKYEKNGYNIVTVKIEISIKNQKFIENNSITENKSMGQSICEKNDLTEKIITNDF